MKLPLPCVRQVCELPPYPLQESPKLLWVNAAKPLISGVSQVRKHTEAFATIPSNHSGMILELLVQLFKPALVTGSFITFMCALPDLLLFP